MSRLSGLERKRDRMAGLEWIGWHPLVIYFGFLCLPHDLLVDKELELFLGQIVLVLIKVKESLWDWFGSWLIIWVVIWFKVWVLQGFLNRDALNRVEGEKLVEQVESLFVDLWEHDLPWYLLFEGKGANVLASSAGLDAVIILHGGSTKDIKNESQLMVIIFSGEERLSAQHFSQDATDTPDVNGPCVFLKGQHDLWSTVPTSSNIFRHEARVVFGRSGTTGKTKITDF